MSDTFIKVSGKSRLARSMVMAACFVVLVAGIRSASTIIVPFLLAVFMAVVITPAFLFLKRRGVPPLIAWLILISIMLAVTSLSIIGISKSVKEATVKMPTYNRVLVAHVKDGVAWLNEHNFDVEESQVLQTFNPASAMKIATNTMGVIGGLVSQAFIILLIAIFILLEAAVLPEKVRSIPWLGGGAWQRLSQIMVDIRQYMAIKTVMSLLTGLFVGIWCELREIDYPVLMGLLAFGLNFVPSVGSIVAAAPALFLSFAEFSPKHALITMVGYLAINVSISNFLEPRFLGNRLGLSPMVVIVSMFFWGWVLGPIGMLLAVPLMMAIKIGLESGPSTNWIALLIGSANNLRKHELEPEDTPEGLLERSLKNAGRSAANPQD